MDSCMNPNPYYIRIVYYTISTTIYKLSIYCIMFLFCKREMINSMTSGHLQPLTDVCISEINILYILYNNKCTELRSCTYIVYRYTIIICASYVGTRTYNILCFIRLLGCDIIVRVNYIDSIPLKVFYSNNNNILLIRSTVCEMRLLSRPVLNALRVV